MLSELRRQIQQIDTEIATLVAALDTRLALAVVAGWAADIGALRCRMHECARWLSADSWEHIDTSDLHALIAPRTLIVQTGKRDESYSVPGRSGLPPFVSDRIVLSRSRVAFDGEAGGLLVHYLHEGGHEIRVDTGLEFMRRWL